MSAQSTCKRQVIDQRPARRPNGNIISMNSSTASKPTSKTGLLRWDDLPHWQRDNEYIISNYRPASNSYRGSLASIFAIHNETVNIHSHLFGGLLFLVLPIYAYRYLYLSQPTGSSADVFVLACFFYGVAACFFLSTAYHILSDHSASIAAFGNQLDYLGVVILMWGATIPTIYYGFYDDETLQILYWTIVSGLAIICAVATLRPSFRTPAFRLYRAMMYAALGLSALGSVIHGIWRYGWTKQRLTMSLDWLIVVSLFNILGVTMYVARIPEKWYPERFDVLGSSHQIFHFVVIIAGLAHMMGLFRAFAYIHGLQGQEIT